MEEELLVYVLIPRTCNSPKMLCQDAEMCGGSGGGSRRLLTTALPASSPVAAHNVHEPLLAPSNLPPKSGPCVMGSEFGT